MMTAQYLKVRDAAEELDLEPERVARLARWLKLDPREQFIPREEVQRLLHEADAEERYNALRCWLLGHLPQHA
jgi:hypothetical protein